MQLFRAFCVRLAIALNALALVCCALSNATAQQLNVAVRVAPDSARVFIEGKCAPTAVWSFRDSYAGVLGLGSRIERFILFDEAGNGIPTRKIAPGQFESTRPASRFQYEVSLTPPQRPADAARVSWLTKERGLLMLADLLPLPASPDAGPEKAIVQFKLPDSCPVYSNEEETPQGGFEVADVGRAVFVVGTHLRTSHISESGMTFGLVTDGDWAFADRDAIEMAVKVLKAHREVFGAMPAKKGTLILFPFPQTVGASEWSAETRGSTVTLLMGKLPSKVGALAQLSTPLTHELFHLWVPNGLALDGDYDWFYEGFTIYQAARAAVRLDLLTFPEFLNAIARAYDGYRAANDHDRWSLIDASKRRWTTGETSVYSKSLVTAFIYDLRLRRLSHGKRSLDNAYRSLFQQRGLVDSISNSIKTSGATDGNDAATEALALDSGAEDFVRVFVRNPVTINLAAELAPFGLSVEVAGLRTRVAVGEKLSKQQRDLLRQLGYNELTHAPRSK